MTHNLFVLYTKQQELDNFKAEVKPGYADVLMAVWETVCAPVLRAIDWFSKQNTERFVKRMERSAEENS